MPVGYSIYPKRLVLRVQILPEVITRSSEMSCCIHNHNRSYRKWMPSLSQVPCPTNGRSYRMWMSGISEILWYTSDRTYRKWIPVCPKCYALQITKLTGSEHPVCPEGPGLEPRRGTGTLQRWNSCNMKSMHFCSSTHVSATSWRF